MERIGLHLSDACPPGIHRPPDSVTLTTVSTVGFDGFRVGFNLVIEV